MPNGRAHDAGIALEFRHLRSAEARARLIQLRQAVAPILANNVLHHFTDHSVSHSDSVCALVDELITTLQTGDAPLSDVELLVLYAACYLHDIGMQFEAAGNTRVVRELQLTTPWEQLSEEDKRILLRNHHHKISAELVSGSVGTAQPPIGIQLKESDRASEIAAICEAHCVTPGTARYVELMAETPGIRKRLLTGLLRLADILDESCHRAYREKANALLLNLESQSHWWRHYYTKAVKVDPNTKTITIWFEFPADRDSEYRRVIPELQVPWIEKELEHHQSAFIPAGLGWVLRQQFKSEPYGTVEKMPEDVLTEMIKQLQRQRKKNDEQSRQLALQTFAEARPIVERQLAALRQQKVVLPIDDYIRDLARLASDLWEVGAQRSAWIVLSGEFERGFATLDTDLRIKVGCKLLQMLMDDDVPGHGSSWVGQLEKDLRSLRPTAPQKSEGLQIVARWYRSVCDYINALAAYKKAIEHTDDMPSRNCLAAEVQEMHYLQGEVGRILEETAALDTSNLGGDASVRSVIIRAQVLGRIGKHANARDLVDRFIAAGSSLSQQDQIDLWMTKAEILYLDCKGVEALEIFVEKIDPLLAGASNNCALVVGFNRADVSHSIFQPSSFYELVDQGRVAGIELWGQEAILESQEAAAAGKHHRSLPKIWRELLRATRQGCWSPSRVASRQMAKQCLILGCADVAAFHTILARDEEIAKEVGGALARSGTADGLTQSVEVFVRCGALQQCFVTACQALQPLVDAIPDGLVETVFNWLLERAQIVPESLGERRTMDTAWRLLVEFAFRLNDDQASRLLETATRHPSWERVPERPNEVVPVRREMVRAITGAVCRMSARTVACAADAVLPLATDRRQPLDFPDVIGCLCQLVARGGSRLAVRLRPALYPKGKRIDSVLIQTASVFNEPISDSKQLGTFAEKVTVDLRKQVQQIGGGEQAKAPSGTLFTITGPHGPAQTVVHVVETTHLFAALQHRAALPSKAIERLVDAMLQMVREPENVLMNKIVMTQALALVGDRCSTKTARRIFDVLVPMARGEIVEPNCVMSAANVANPLNPFKLDFGKPNDLRAVAIHTLACIARDKKRHFDRVVSELIDLALVETDATIRTAAISAAREAPTLSETGFATLMLATRDQDPQVADAAFCSVARLGAAIRGNVSWQLVLQSFRLAAQCEDVRVRRGAAFAVSRLLPYAPAGKIQRSLKTIRRDFRSDRCFSVRHADKFGRVLKATDPRR